MKRFIGIFLLFLYTSEISSSYGATLSLNENLNQNHNQLSDIEVAMPIKETKNSQQDKNFGITVSDNILYSLSQKISSSSKNEKESSDNEENEQNRNTTHIKDKKEFEKNIVEINSKDVKIKKNNKDKDSQENINDSNKDLTSEDYIIQLITKKYSSPVDKNTVQKVKFSDIKVEQKNDNKYNKTQSLKEKNSDKKLTETKKEEQNTNTTDLSQEDYILQLITKKYSSSGTNKKSIQLKNSDIIIDENSENTEIKKAVKKQVLPDYEYKKSTVSNGDNIKNNKSEDSVEDYIIKLINKKYSSDPNKKKSEIINAISLPQEEKEFNSNLNTKRIFPINTTEINKDENILNLTLKPQIPIRPEGIIFKETQTNFDNIDPLKADNPNNNYPGLRGPNQLIVYTPAYGKRTGTNEYGTEAIIENNMVISLNGADSIIPKQGFVISGHGNAKKWITQNIQIGSKVYLDYSTNSIKVFLTPESLLFAAKEKLKEVSNLVEYYRQIDILYNEKKATEYLNFSKNYLRKAEKEPEKTQQFIKNAMESLDSAIKNALPYIENELKGVWLRPTEKSETEIQKTLERLSNTGITDIFLETYYHGKTIYPSEYLKDCGVISQRLEFRGFDPLEVWIREAHKRNIKVHIWFEAFYVGNDKPDSSPNHVLSVYPHWANKRLYNYDSKEPVPSLSEHNGYFLDPSNYQVRKYLTGILNEIITKYNPDGINLDYIRYPQTVEPAYSNYAAMNWGYTKNARNIYMSIYGVDPINIKYGTRDWNNWSLFRQNQITKFVADTKKLTSKHNIPLTAVVFPDLNKCITTKMQNWKAWSMNNYIDGLTPLILTGDKNTADVLLNDIIKNTKSETKIYPGLFVTFMGGSMDDLLMQIHKTREYKTGGTILFDYAHLNDTYVDALKTRIFNKSYEPRDTKIINPQEEPPVVQEKDDKKETTQVKKKRFWGKKNANN